MNLTLVNIDDLHIEPTRQRSEFDDEKIVELSDSIARNGLIHPVVIRRDAEGRQTLVAGERRLKAIDILWQTGQTVRCGTQEIPDGLVPCLYLGELDPIDAFEVELDENIRRTDLTWQERATAVSKLVDLRRRQAERSGTPQPTHASIALEITGRSDGEFATSVRDQLVVSRYLEDPDVAKATSLKEAFKIVARKESLAKSAQLGIEVGRTFHAGMHKIHQADCIEWLASCTDKFDVVLTDPPYGMEAQDFGDSGGKTPGSHFYDDSFENWSRLMGAFFESAFRVCREQAHAYVFCDIDNFGRLKEYASGAGWKVFRTPLIWVNPTGMRAPWPEMGPQRKWQSILYAVKGSKPVTRLYSDVLTYPSDANLNHHAQKPVALYRDLLGRSIRPGDRVLDPFCGSGTIFPACHELKCIATGVELDSSAYGISVARLGELK
jgi:ParB/RepB/Spo0J family partition protein